MESQHVSIKAAFVLLAVGLQKPHKKSKAKDHQKCLANRLRLWKGGEIDQLLLEGRMIQHRWPVGGGQIHPIKQKCLPTLS